MTEPHGDGVATTRPAGIDARTGGILAQAPHFAATVRFLRRGLHCYSLMVDWGLLSQPHYRPVFMMAKLPRHRTSLPEERLVYGTRDTDFMAN